MAEKYVVFKVEDWDKWLSQVNGIQPGGVAFMGPSKVPDAVVIRRQDMFAPPALDSYSNSIQIAWSLMSPDAKVRFGYLVNVADFFHEQATLSWDTNRKIPD